MYSGALDAQQDAQVDGGPAGVGLAAVAALLVPRQTLDALQDGFAAHAALSRLAGRVDAAGGRRGCSVQVLRVEDTQTATLPSQIAARFAGTICHKVSSVWTSM